MFEVDTDATQEVNEHDRASVKARKVIVRLDVLCCPSKESDICSCPAIKFEADPSR
jgi:hypothetical protein